MPPLRLIGGRRVGQGLDQNAVGLGPHRLPAGEAGQGLIAQAEEWGAQGGGQAQVVIRVVDGGQERDQILDLWPVVVAAAAHGEVGQAGGAEALLVEGHVGGGPEEDGGIVIAEWAVGVRVLVPHGVARALQLVKALGDEVGLEEPGLLRAQVRLVLRFLGSNTSSTGAARSVEPAGGNQGPRTGLVVGIPFAHRRQEPIDGSLSAVTRAS